MENNKESLSSKTAYIVLDGKEKKSALFGTLSLMIADFFISLCIAICLPNILGKFDATDLYTPIVVIRSVESALGMLIGGKLGDIFGRKRLVQILVPVLIISGAVCGIALDISTFLIAIVILGFVNGILIVTGFSIVTDIAETSERSAYFGYVSTVTNLAMVATPFIAGALTDLKVPSFTFFVPIPFAAIAYLLLMKNYQNKPVESTKGLDFIGFTYITIVVASFITILTIGGKQVEWTSPVIIALLVIGVIFTVLMIRNLTKSKNPIIDLHLFKAKSFTVSSILTGLKMPYTTILTVYIVLYIQKVLGQSATSSGMVSLPKTIATILLPVTFVTIMKKRHKGSFRPLLVYSMALTIIAVAVMTFGLGFEIVFILFLVASLLLGIAESMQAVTLQPYGLSEVERHQLGMANSMLTFIPAIVSSFVTAGFGMILNMYETGVGDALPVMGYIALIAAVVSFLITYKYVPE